MAFDIVILGCGSARPMAMRHPAAQALVTQRHIYLIDCGEGTQMQMARASLPLERIRAIFLTHLHADHLLGLFGVITSLSMSSRVKPLHIYAHPNLEPWLEFNIRFHVEHKRFPIQFHPIPPAEELTPQAPPIYQDKAIRVMGIPLDHRIPTTGFRFQEVATPPNIRQEVVKKYQLVPQQIYHLKQGHALSLANEKVLTPSKALYHKRYPASYAYLSDTRYCPSVLPYIEGIELLYHEATYCADLKELAHTTGHSTAQQAATIARDAKVCKLLVGHYSRRYTTLTPLLEEAQAVFPNTRLAMELDLHRVAHYATP